MWISRSIVCILVLILDVQAMAARAQGSQCAANITHTGGGIFMSAGLVTTHEDFPALPPEKALKMIYKEIVRSGWTVSSMDRSMGVISAIKSENNIFGAMNGSSDHSKSLNIEVDQLGSGSKVTVTSTLLSGHSYSKADFAHFVCDPIAPLEQPQ